MKHYLQICLVLLTSILIPFRNLRADNSSSISIGAMLHLTGEFAMQGQAFREGVELAADTINNSGGIKGVKIHVVFEDTQYKPLQAATAAKKLSGSKEVVANIISVVTEAKAAAPILEKAKLPSIVLWDSSPELEDSGDYIFGIGPWAPSSGEKSAEFAFNTLKVKDAVIINTNTEWSDYVSDYFEKAFKKAGGEIRGKFSLDPSEVDFRSTLLRAKALNPGIMYVPIDSNILPFFKQIRQLGITTPLITSDILDKELYDQGKGIFEGVFQSQTGDPEFPASIKMKELYKKKYGHEADFLLLTAWGYDAVNVIAASIEKAGADREAIKNELYKVKAFQGASGEITFNEKGSAPREVRVFRVHNGKPEVFSHG